MQAVVLNSFAGLDGLDLVELPNPMPDDGEAAVRIHAAALGPWDLSAANGAFAAMGGSSDFPQIQGWDFAGETLDGERVFGFVAQPWMGAGAFAEQISLPTGILAPLPDSLGFAEASALPVCGLTARLLVNGAAVGDDDLVLVTGAAGMVGGFAAQLCVARGARVVAAVREADADEARRLGAEAVVTVGDELETEVLGRWPGGVDACLDTVGLGDAALVCVRDGGTFMTSVPPAVPSAAREITVSGVQVQPDAKGAAELAGLAATGKLTVRVSEVMPLARYHDAYAKLAGGGLHGKVVLTP